MKTVQELLTHIVEGQTTVIDLQQDLDNGTPKRILEIRTEKQPPLSPIRAESKRRAHTFYDVLSFKSYLTKYGGADTVVYGNPETGVIHATINEKALTGVEVLRFEPMLHPLWRPWELLLKASVIPLDAFVDFVAKNRRTIINPMGRELLMLFSQIHASTHKELDRGRGKNAVNGMIVTTKIQGVDKAERVELPDAIEISVPIFVRTSPRIIEIDLTIGVDSEGEDVQITLAAADLMEAKFKAFEEMFATLTELKDMTVTLGDPAHKEWDYLK